MTFVITCLLAALLGAALARAPVYDLNVVPEHCVRAPPAEGNYTPIGLFEDFNGLQVYTTGRRDSQRALIDVYDIFAYTMNTLQVADLVAQEADLLVVVPDFFHNSSFSKDGKMPKDPKVIADFLELHGAWEDTVRADVVKVLDVLKSEGKNQFGIYGFCWGGKISTQAVTDLDDFAAAALVHPSSVTNEEALGVKAPMYLMPASNDPDMFPFFKTLVEKFGPNEVGHYRYHNLNHGFAGARGNFSDPDNVKAVERVVYTVATFMNGHFEK